MRRHRCGTITTIFVTRKRNFEYARIRANRNYRAAITTTIARFCEKFPSLSLLFFLSFTCAVRRGAFCRSFRTAAGKRLKADPEADQRAEAADTMHNVIIPSGRVQNRQLGNQSQPARSFRFGEGEVGTCA